LIVYFVCCADLPNEKRSFGISTHQWLIQHRIEHSKELMSHTTMPLIEIAIQGTPRSR